MPNKNNNNDNVYYYETPQQDIEMNEINGEQALTTRTRRRMNAINNNDRPRPFQPTTTTVTASNSQRLAQHMTIAGSFLDFALFVADVEHLKYLLDAGKENIRYYNLLIILISSSLFIQIIVVILLFIVGFKRTESTTVTHHRDSYNDNDDQKDYQPNPGLIDQISLNDDSYLNKTIIILVTVIAIINVFVTVFGDRSSADLIQKYRSGVNITEF